MSARGFLAVMTLAVCALCAAVASATVLERPFRIRVIEMPDGVVAGEPARVVLGYAARDGRVERGDVRLDGRGWAVREIHAEKALAALDPGEIGLAYEVVPDGTWQPLTVSVDRNGETHSQALDLSPLAERIARVGGRLETSTTPETAPAAAAPYRWEGPGGPVRPMDAARLAKYAPEGALAAQAAAPAPQNTRTLHAFGYIKYDYARTNLPVVAYPAYGATVQLMVYTRVSGFMYLPVPLAVGVTARDGSFSLYAEVPAGEAVDVYVHCVAGNGEFVVMEPNYVREIEYHWSSSVRRGVTDSFVDFNIQKAQGGYIGALNIMSSLTRAYDFLCTNGGFGDLPDLDVWWPTSDGQSSYAEYDPVWNPTPDINIRNTRTWWNTTHIHEYGHHFVYETATGIPAEYCNPGNYCDDDPTFYDCGHCGFCPENERVAFGEGFPSWVATYICIDWGTNEQPGPTNSDRTKNTEKCSQSSPSFLADPWKTEGFFTTVLHDITSEGYHNDPNFPLFADNMTAPPAKVVQTVSQAHPVTPWEFLEAFNDRYPQYGALFWETCANNGYGAIDTTPPTAGPLGSPSHPLNVASPGNRIVIDVSAFSDDLAGIDGFCMTWGRDAPISPPAVITHPYEGVNILTDQLTPGTYYVSVRAVDRQGNWSSDVRTYGPAVVRAPDPADLLPEPWTAGWPYALIPRSSPITDQYNIPAETTPLALNTYWNACITNDGEVAVSAHDTHVLVDGADKTSYSGSIPAWGDHVIVTDGGPVFVTPGRHTFELAADYGASVAESDETNNTWAKQWIWQPQTMSANSMYGRNSPPPRTGGWPSIPEPGKWYNCYGMRVPTGASAPSPWVAVWMRTREPSGDLDVRLHPETNSATSGFGSRHAYSARPAGCLDAVLVNAAVNPADNYDVGYLTSASEDQEYFYTKAAYAVALAEDTPVTAWLTSGEGLDLYSFDAAPNVPYTIELSYDPGAADPGPLWMSRYDAAFGYGDLLDYASVGATDSTRTITLAFESPQGPQSVHAIAVWRDNGENSYAAQTYTIEVKRTPPDLVPNFPAGWAGPLVPRPSSDATTTWAPYPDVLHGDQASTYVSTSIANVTSIVSNGVMGGIRLDGVLVAQQAHGPFLGGAESMQPGAFPVTVRGGRHTMTLVVDLDDVVEESKEWNNLWGWQYVWEPYNLGFNYKIARNEPPGRTSSWDGLDPEGIHWFNCDGVRTPTWAPSGANHHWGAVAILPSAGADHDLDLHDVSTGPDNGFAVPLATSAWPPGESDFVLMNFRNTPTRTFDAGIELEGLSTGGYYFISAARSVGLPADPDGPVGYFTFGTEDLVQLYEIEFTVEGNYTASLVVDDPLVDLGFSLYPPETVVGAKSDIVAGSAIGWTESVTDSFDFTVGAGETGRYCLAVWKVASAAAHQGTSFNLVIDLTMASPVGDDVLPRVSALGAVYPNPFNPRTTIRFDLARASATKLTIHDVAGAVVATLEDGALPAGGHRVVWEGRDDAGRRVASGTYFVQLVADGLRQTRKIVLVK